MDAEKKNFKKRKVKREKKRVEKLERELENKRDMLLRKLEEASSEDEH